MRALHTASALIELGAGLALVCCPSASVTILLGVPLNEPAGLTVVRVGGAAVLALGVACWIARGDTRSRAATGLVAAMLLYNVAVVAVLAYAGLGLGLFGVALWPGVALHVVMTGWCIACLVQSVPRNDGQQLAATINEGKRTTKVAAAPNGVQN
jgi:hypothetical protein